MSVQKGSRSDVPCWQQWDHYQTALLEFEQQFGMDSETFYQRFEAGSLGDDMDFFEWAGLYELSQHLRPQIHRLEQALSESMPTCTRHDADLRLG